MMIGEIYKKSIGEDIEMLGFLLVTKDESLARLITENNPKERILTKIIVLPQFEPLLEEQGFAEIRGFSSFEDENEVVFNIQSRFTILEAACEKKESSKNNYLTLLHGENAIQTYVARLKPVIELQSYEIAQTNCVYCQAQIRNKVLLLDLNTKDSYACIDCIRITANRTRKPYVCLSPSNEKLKESGQTMRIAGKVLSFLDHFDIPFYGSKCIGCLKTNIERQFKCLKPGCKKANKIWCQECFNDEENNCINDKHLMIYEDHPYTFWPGETQIDSEGDFSDEEEVIQHADVDSLQAKGEVKIEKAYEESKVKEDKREALGDNVRNKEQSTRNDQIIEQERDESSPTKVEEKESEEEPNRENDIRESKQEKYKEPRGKAQVVKESRESDDGYGDLEAVSGEDEKEEEKEKEKKQGIQSAILRKEDTNIPEQKKEESQVTKAERRESQGQSDLEIAVDSESNSESGSESDNDSDSEQDDLKDKK